LPGRAERLLGGEGRLHRRDRSRHAHQRGCHYCIIGHSERRGYFGETDEDINKKAKALMAHGIVPISCCGESLEVREAGKHVEFVVEQIKKDTEGLRSPIPPSTLWPTSPSGPSAPARPPRPTTPQEVCGAIRKTLAEIFGQETGDGIRILYGGSAKPENVAGFLRRRTSRPRRRALVGGASLKADSLPSKGRPWPMANPQGRGIVGPSLVDARRIA
jgi:triosephosphate isomerase